MTPEQRKRNARRLLMAIERRGGQWILVNWDKFALAHFWLPSRLKRRLKALEPECLLILQNAALEAASKDSIPLPEPKERPHTATIH